MPRASNYLDHVIVVGAGLGGLSAAIYAMLGGAKKVTVIETADAAGGKAKPELVGDYRFDPGPSIVILIEIYQQLFFDAGKDINDYLQFVRLDPFTRVFSNEFQTVLDFPADENDCLEYLSEVIPQDALAIKKLMRDLGKVSGELDRSIYAHPFESAKDLVNPGLVKFALKAPTFQPYKKEVDKRFKSSLLRAFFYGFPSYSGQTYLEGSPGSFMIPFYMLRKGLYWPIGGIGAIPAALYRLATELGIEFRFNEHVSSVNMSSDNLRIDSVNVRPTNMQSNSERLECTAIISNRDRLSSEAWVRPERDVLPGLSYFTLQFGYESALPTLIHHNLFIPDEFEKSFEELYVQNQFPNEPLVYLNETSHFDAGSAPAGHSNVFAVVTSPALHPKIDWENSIEKYRNRTLTTLERTGLKIDPSKVRCERIQTPAYFERAHGNYRGSLYGATSKDKLWGFMPLRCKDEVIENLYYVGCGVQPGAGMPMVTLSGKFAAQLLVKSSRK